MFSYKFGGIYSAENGSCPVPLCGNPSTPILASTGKMKPLFLFMIGLSSDGTDPKNSEMS